MPSFFDPMIGVSREPERDPDPVNVVAPVALRPRVPHPHVTVANLDIPDDTRRAFGHLLDKMADKPLPFPAGWRVMVLQYVRPERTAGGLILSDKTLQEDKWQGRVGLVLALGPGCWSDENKYPEGRWAEVGDVIMWPRLEATSTPMEFHGCTLAFLNDDAVVAYNVDPEQGIR